MQAMIDYIKSELKGYYPDDEVRSFTFLMLCKLTGLSRTEIILNKNTHFSKKEYDLLGSFIDKLKNNTPIQYVLGDAEFMGMPFRVDDSVLIPRPETEELVEWIVQLNSYSKVDILDVGTGSGCIAIALKKMMPQAELWAFDVSDVALETARANAALNQVNVRFEKQDVFKTLVSSQQWDIIVSNPPYIPEGEKNSILPNVLNYEPHLALFVPDHDPLIFYKRIAAIAAERLKPGGQLFFEIHRDFGRQTVELLNQTGFVDVQLRKDMQGNDRMIKAVKK